MNLVQVKNYYLYFFGIMMKTHNHMELGSARELDAQIEIATKVGFIGENEMPELQSKVGGIPKCCAD